MSRCSSRRLEVEELIAAYRDDLRAAGMFAEHPVTSPARTFLNRVGIDGWQQLSLAEQSDGRFLLGLGVSHGPFVEGALGYKYESPAAKMADGIATTSPPTAAMITTASR